MIFLITGANGYLGTIVTEVLEKKGHRVLSLGMSDDNDYVCDLTVDDPDKIVAEIDYVIHAAGKAHVVPKTEEERASFYKINVDGTQNLLKMLPDIKGLIFISTVAVYGKDTGALISENHPLDATDPYGKSKIEAEQIVLDWGQENDVNVSIVRPPLVLGKNAPGNLGSMVKAIKRGRYANINGGKAKRSVVLATDIAEHIELIMKYPGIYNLTDDYNPSFEEISMGISKKLGKNKVRNLPLVLAKGLALIGDGMQTIMKKEMPFSTYKLNKVTSDLTFSSEKAKSIGWKPQNAISNLDSWL